MNKQQPAKKTLPRLVSIPRKGAAFTILELLIALGMGAIVIAAAANMMGGVYFSQKKIEVTQNFSSETRLLMERITQLVRNNTIDYDRYFVEYGPSIITCPSFDDNQTPEGIGALTNSDIDPAVNKANRQSLGYPTIFLWDTNEDGIPDRNLGGKSPDGTTIDPCTVVQWQEASILLLINADRNLQTSIRQDGLDPVARHIQVQTRIGSDSNNDENADMWTPYTEWNGNSCELFADEAKTTPLGGTFIGEETLDFCNQAHDWVTISPEQIEVETLRFSPSPTQDPFLSFAVNEAQIHPLISVLMDATLRSPGEFGMTADEAPRVSLQTSVSSRVFGNTRE